MRQLLMVFGLSAGLWAGQVSAEDSLTVSLQRLTLGTATKVAQAAMEACRQKGIQIGVTLVDRDGGVQVTLRDTIAPSITVPISRDKAFTAANFNAPTSQLISRADTALGSIDGLILLDGGVPIRAGGQLLGAVGVSGAPDSKIDEECAQAGVDAVADDLEMSL